jgi:hypothetical protein
MMTSGSELSLNLRWPYQANVMKTFEANSIRIGKTDGETAGMKILSNLGAKGPGRAALRLRSISFDVMPRKAAPFP